MAFSIPAHIASLQHPLNPVMTARCREVGGINLGQGFADFPPPEVLIEATAKAMRDGANQYTAPEGDLGFRKALAAKLARKNNLTADPATEIAVTVGASGALGMTLMTLLSRGDGVLFFEPFWDYYRTLLDILGLEANIVDLIDLQDDAPRISEERLAAALTPATRAILLSSPSNPDGHVLAESEIVTALDFARKHGLLVISDEVYEDFVYSGHRHVSAASLPAASDLPIVTIMSLSKAYSITGWRVGYCVANREIVDRIKLVNGVVNACAPLPFQVGAIAALQEAESYVQDIRTRLEASRLVLCNALCSAGFEARPPMGGFFQLAGIPKGAPLRGLAFALDLLDRIGVAGIPGEVYFQNGAKGAGFIRFCFAKNETTIEEAVQRLRLLPC